MKPHPTLSKGDGEKTETREKVIFEEQNEDVYKKEFAAAVASADLDVGNGAGNIKNRVDEISRWR